MTKKHIRYGLLGLLVVAVAVLIFAQPKADPGRLDFDGFREGPAGQRAFFVYHPPQGLKGSCFVSFLWLDVPTDAEISDYYVSQEQAYAGKVIELECLPPANAVWRVRADASVPLKGVHVLYRIKNVWDEKSFNAWNSPCRRHFAPVYSVPITNPVPSTP